jgi:imidazolonepropionase-like amidohydrolase
VIDSWTRLHRNGARIVPGTDAGVAPLKPHDVLPYGLTALTGLGMTNLEALRAATSVAADACGLTGRKGRLVAGADADLLAVTGDPLSDIYAIHDVAAVMRAGRWVR